jgi:hypothetical protein
MLYWRLVARMSGLAAELHGLKGSASPTIDSAVPFKANIARRHLIPKQRHGGTNRVAYDVASRQRGRLTVWFSEEAIAAWQAEPRRTRGGQTHYPALAIMTALTLRWDILTLRLQQKGR